MKVSEAWLRSIVNPEISSKEWIEQFIQSGIEVDSVEVFDETKTKEAGKTNEASKTNASSKTSASKDTVLTLKVSPNRSDCLSMEGLAREWAAMNQTPFSKLNHESVLPKVSETFPIEVQAKTACPCYVGRIIQNINATAETPDWLVQRLEKAGIRSLSPVVDVTNYVMLELGQPMHAFDLATLDAKIMVRMAKTGETIQTLDGKMVNLDKTTLVIADSKDPIAIAGIMGGEASSVTSNTKKLFLEAAYFDPIHIRKTSQHYKLRTESSIRFERGIDPQLPIRAMERATALLVEIVGGNVGPLMEHGVIEARSLPTVLSLRGRRIQDILGITIPKQVVEDKLTRLGMTLAATSTEDWEVTVPSFRPDITLEIDLIEELARLYGFQHIPEIMPEVTLLGNPLPENQVEVSTLKEILVSRGYREIITYSFVSPLSHQLLQRQEAALALTNPISQDMSIMRESLLPGLLQALQYNQARQMLRARFFEVGNIFLQEASQIKERAMLAGLISGSLFKEQWGEKTRSVDFFDLKNDIEALLSLKGEVANLRTSLEFCSTTHPLLHPGQAAEIREGSKVLGVMGALHPAIAKQLDLQGSVILFELSLSACRMINPLKFSEMSNYPAVRRDIAVIVAEKVLANELKSAIVNCVGPLLRDVSIFDVYQGKGIESGRKSVALSLLFQHPDRTLVEEEVNAIMKKVVQVLTDKYHAILRE